MPKSTTFASDTLGLYFNGTLIANLAQNATSSPLGYLYLSLHNSTGPGIGGTQATNETAYTNYNRVAVARTSAGWTVASNVVSNTALAQFAQCGASGDTITYVAIGTGVSAGTTSLVLYEGALSSSLAVANGIQPQFAASALTVTET